jgi:hypothetical protein
MFVKGGKVTGSVLVRDLDKLDEVEFATPEPFVPELEPEPEPEPELEPVEPEVVSVEIVEAPNVSDLKPEWVKYAVKQGMSKEAAEATTKESLIERFG